MSGHRQRWPGCADRGRVRVDPGNTLIMGLLTVTVGVPAYHLVMTAAFDGSRGTDQRFTDALSGSDGTSDPSVLMPVLDVYPDALSAAMPVDVIPVVALPTPPVAGVRADPVVGPAGRPPPRPRQGGQRQAQTRQPARQAAGPPAQRAVPARPQVQPARPTTAAAGSSAGQRSFQSTHPQSSGSGALSAVAPVAPMASQYSGRGQARNDARERSQERRRTAPPTGTKRSSSVGAVIVFLIVLLFATGWGQKVIDLITELLNR